MTLTLEVVAGALGDRRLCFCTFSFLTFVAPVETCYKIESSTFRHVEHLLFSELSKTLGQARVLVARCGVLYSSVALKYCTSLLLSEHSWLLPNFGNSFHRAPGTPSFLASRLALLVPSQPLKMAQPQGKVLSLPLPQPPFSLGDLSSPHGSLGLTSQFLFPAQTSHLNSRIGEKAACPTDL